LCVIVVKAVADVRDCEKAFEKAAPMDQNVTSIERAFQLAKSGDCASISDIKKSLQRDGYAAGQITGPLLLKQLREAIRSVQPATTE
jgi:hypothetical protein